MAYLPTFTMKISQMWVNISYMDPMEIVCIYSVLCLPKKCKKNLGHLRSEKGWHHPKTGRGSKRARYAKRGSGLAR